MKTTAGTTVGWLAMMSLASATAGAAPAPTGTISVTVLEAGRDDPLPCRAWVDAGGKRHHKPQADTAAPYPRDRSFSCDGRFTIDLPAGRAVVHVERGKEYVPVDREVTVVPGETTELTITLSRWIHMKQEGWYSSDLHVHFGHDRPAVLEQLVLADDVNLLPSFSYWNHFEKEWPPFARPRTVAVGPAYLITRANEEIERIGGPPFHSVGALFIFGLDKPVHVPRHDHTYPCDAALARIAKRTSPECVIDTDKPLWAENVVTMALGLFDSVQVCHNHAHRLATFGNGGLCCGMADDPIEEEHHDWAGDELFIRTNRVYYRWLNCGFKLAASGGSAMGVMPVPLGYSRTYAELDGPLTESNYLAAIRRGNTFATSGPMLTMTANGQPMGTTIKYPTTTRGPLTVRSRLRSIDKLEAYEVVHDGRVIQRIALTDSEPSPVLDRTFETKLVPVRSGWVATRAIFRAPDGHLRQAHTSPVYIDVDGKPIASRRDAAYMIRWIDRLIEVSETPDRYKSQSDRAEAQALFREARQVYQRIARTATEVWGDAAGAN